MVCIQERLVIKSSLWWGVYGIWISYNFQILIQKTNTIRGNMVCKFIHSYSSSDIITFSSGQDGIWLSLKFLLANFFLSILPCYFSYTYVFFSQSSPAHSLKLIFHIINMPQDPSVSLSVVLLLPPPRSIFSKSLVVALYQPEENHSSIEWKKDKKQ